MIQDIAFVLFYYAIAWSIPGVIMSAMVSLGDPKRIIFIDHQLSKNVEKLHSNPRCMISTNIACRLFWFWIIYPFRRSRVTTESMKFRIFMWINALGMWSYILCFGLIIIGKRFS
ncbi:hypothetical protein BA953_21195 [Vibrio coralliilyticus]|nr:hypothetical protein [Vibrio coralliilyticus]ANW26668.1 hypothetical protein BA953_21195 [Vibrio coralliilyticus]